MTLPDDALIFINYRRADSAWTAEAFAEKLEAAFGKDSVYHDVRDMRAGDDWRAELDEKLSRTAVMLVLIGKDWLAAHDEYGRRRLDQRSDWVHREIRAALKNERCRVIPVLLDDAKLPDKKALPGALRALSKSHHVSVRYTRKDDDLEALATQIENAGFRRLAPGAAQRAPQAAAIEPIHLLRPLRFVDMDLASHVARGNAQRQDVLAWLSHPPLEEHDFRDKSKTWHDWRQALEYTIIARSFTRPDDLLSRLRMHRIEHMNCDVSPWQSRAQALPRDWSRDLEFVEDLRHRLPNYERHRGGV